MTGPRGPLANNPGLHARQEEITVPAARPLAP